MAAKEVSEERPEKVYGDGERPGELAVGEVVGALVATREPGRLGWQRERVDADAEARGGRAGDGATEPGGVGVSQDERGVGAAGREEAGEVGRASCRERV